MNGRSAFAILVLSLASGMALAGGAVALPEPGVLELLAIAGVAAVALAIRNRRK
jgi:hypothetical protein